jgi:hypothetical protein
MMAKRSMQARSRTWVSEGRSTAIRTGAREGEVVWFGGIGWFVDFIVRILGVVVVLGCCLDGTSWLTWSGTIGAVREYHNRAFWPPIYAFKI